MNELPEELFSDPVWHALETRHRHFALIEGDARRYPADVSPFAAVASPSKAALRQLHSLLAEGESVWVVGTAFPDVPELRNEGTLVCAQMVLTTELAEKESPIAVERLSAADSPAMIALTDVAFPGFFRSRTHEMGAYYGARWDCTLPDESGPRASVGGSSPPLMAMAGERMALEGYTEISGVCTHPLRRGKGLAANLIARLANDHQRQGVVSFLHVSAANAHAIDLYRRLGFAEARTITLTRFSRASPQRS